MSQPVSERVQKHREMLRSHGLRPIQLWVPDSRKVGFSEECQKQSLMLKGDHQEIATLKWLESISDTEGWV
jgi:hypothetical protein